MERLKDFFYNKNDIVVVILIVIVAGLIISSRVDAIMGYPRLLAAELEAKQQEQQEKDDSLPVVPESGDENANHSDGNHPSNIPNSATGNGDTDNTGTENPLEKQPEIDSPGQGENPNGGNTQGGYSSTTGTVTVTIPSGASGDTIAQILLDVGAINSKKDFTSAVIAASADTKLKAGTFKIPADSTPAEIVSIITK